MSGSPGGLFQALPHILSSVISFNNVLSPRPQRPPRRGFHRRNGINSLLTNLSAPSLVQNQPIKAKCLVGGREGRFGGWGEGGESVSHTVQVPPTSILSLTLASLVSRGKWIHLFSQSAVAAAGLQKIRLRNQLGRETVCCCALVAPACGCQAGRKHRRHTRKRMSVKSKVLKLGLCSVVTPPLSSDHWKYYLVWLTWQKKRCCSLNFDASLCVIHTNICKIPLN